MRFGLAGKFHVKPYNLKVGFVVKKGKVLKNNAHSHKKYYFVTIKTGKPFSISVF